MFYFLTQPNLGYNAILIVAAVIPAVALMIFVAKADKLEKESPRLLRNLVFAGILSALIALLVERVLSFILDKTVAETSPAYNVILYFIIVAGAEEGAKYLLMYRRTWKSPEFNCQYDGVVYAVFVSLGFALWENISYVLHFDGLSTALVRAVTAIPGHACFGVFMGIGYGIAKRYDYLGDRKKSVLFRILSLVVPMLLHGTYDYLTTLTDRTYSWIFVGFVVLLFIVSFILVKRTSKRDRYIDGTPDAPDDSASAANATWRDKRQGADDPSSDAPDDYFD